MKYKKSSVGLTNSSASKNNKLSNLNAGLSLVVLVVCITSASVILGLTHLGFQGILEINTPWGEVRIDTRSTSAETSGVRDK